MSLPSVDTPVRVGAARAGRPMARRLRVRGWLRLETPLHVGGLGGDPSVDLALAVDGQSRLYVPGTSLAGALRAFAARSVTDEDVLDGIWGSVPQNASDAGSASRIIIHDSLVTADTEPGTPLPRSRVEARSGIGIDRVSGTVAHGFLYGRAVIPCGTYLRLEIDLESGEPNRDADPATAMLGTLLLALAGRGIRLGAARTRGLGSVVLEGKPEIVEQRFDSLDGILDALGLVTAPATSPLTPKSLGGTDPDADLLRVEIIWHPASPVMVRSGVDGFAINALPLVSGVEGSDQFALVLPGSSIKGALRSHAERIERTARGVDAPHPLEAQAGPARSARFRAQLDQLAAVNALFGSAGKPDKPDKRSTDDGAPHWGVGALGADDCYSKQPIPGHVWRALNGAHVEGTAETPADRPTRSSEKGRATLPEKTRERLKRLGMDEAEHVAIDRWTGGAAPKRLFSTLEPHHVGWQPLKLAVDLRRLRQFDQDGLDKPALALLLLVLRDLSAGRVRFGHGVNRGHGDITVESIKINGFPASTKTYKDLDELLAEPAVAECAQSWRDYLDHNQLDHNQLDRNQADGSRA
ncbi:MULTISPECIES: RAMP superfamily CRISPR-associated protein [unclassified Frankia]|uniref:RAMP superfamily CRISPR-associated protein n=1 Tax=unclassified Frankia TaxID=2632575 RepID=UPI002AD490F9|nr:MULTISPECIES: RAMP superfamily CRISPR-associated protein [unclassified Frankia]